jgi:hypothetical protein
MPLGLQVEKDWSIAVCNEQINQSTLSGKDNLTAYQSAAKPYRFATVLVLGKGIQNKSDSGF